MRDVRQDRIKLSRCDVAACRCFREVWKGQPRQVDPQLVNCQRPRPTERRHLGDLRGQRRPPSPPPGGRLTSKRRRAVPYRGGSVSRPNWSKGTTPSAPAYLPVRICTFVK